MEDWNWETIFTDYVLYSTTATYLASKEIGQTESPSLDRVCIPCNAVKTDVAKIDTIFLSIGPGFRICDKTVRISVIQSRSLQVCDVVVCKGPFINYVTLKGGGEGVRSV